MDNIITGAIAVAIFLAFVLGLAQSIGAITFRFNCRLCILP